MTSKMFKSVKTPRLLIRPIALSDAEDYFAAEQASISELSPHDVEQ